MNRKRSELLVGLFLFLGLCLLGLMILKFGNFGDSFRPKYVLELRYPTAGGVTKGSEVKFSGVTIGRVKSDPSPNDDFTGALIELSIFEEYRIPEASKISIETEGLLGDSYIAIRPPKIPSGRYLEDGTSVKGAPSGGLSALADSAGDISEAGKEMVDEIRTALHELNSALAKLDTSVLGDENLNLFNDTLAEFNAAVKDLNAEVLGEENTENLRAALENFRKTGENLNKTSATLADQSEKIGPILNSAQGAVDKAEDAMAEIASASKKANSAITRITDGNGLFAALINDKKLRDDFLALVENLRENGVLRYRDNAGDAAAPPRDSRKGILGKNR